MGVIDHMSASEAALQFIRDAEGRGLPGKPWVAYYCQAGKPTIGYGHTKGVTHEDVRNGRICTEAQAEEWLRKDIVQWELAVERNVTVKINQNQYDALISFTHNCGEGALQQVVKYLHRSGADAVPARLMLYRNHTDPKTGKLVRNTGLTRRRTAEVVLWNTPTADEYPAESPVMPQEVKPDTGKPLEVVKKSRTFWSAIVTISGAIWSWIQSFFSAAEHGIEHAQEKLTIWKTLYSVIPVDMHTVIIVVIIGGALGVIYARMNAEVEQKVG